jgi:hypothetical protein
LIRRGLYDDLYSFAEFEKRVGDLGAENSKIVGDALEVFVESYLATNRKMQAETVWLVGQVPSDIRQQLNLPSDTKGIDGVFRTRRGVLVCHSRDGKHLLMGDHDDASPFRGALFGSGALLRRCRRFGLPT